MPQLEHRWEQVRDHPFTCLGCGKANTASRKDAQCCNATCRQRYKRRLAGASRKPAGPPKIDCMLVPTRSDLKLPRTRDKKLVKRLKKLDKLIDTALQTPTRSTTRKKGAKKK